MILTGLEGLKQQQKAQADLAAAPPPAAAAAAAAARMLKLAMTLAEVINLQTYNLFNKIAIRKMTEHNKTYVFFLTKYDTTFRH